MGAQMYRWELTDWRLVQGFDNMGFLMWTSADKFLLSLQNREEQVDWFRQQQSQNKSFMKIGNPQNLFTS